MCCSNLFIKIYFLITWVSTGWQKETGGQKENMLNVSIWYKNTSSGKLFNVKKSLRICTPWGELKLTVRVKWPISYLPKLTIQSSNRNEADNYRLKSGSEDLRQNISWFLALARSLATISYFLQRQLIGFLTREG